MSKKLQSGKGPTDVPDKGKVTQARRPSSSKDRRRIGQNPCGATEFETQNDAENLKTGMMSGPIAVYLAPPIFASIFV